jgi:hypothetical protein
VGPQAAVVVGLGGGVPLVALALPIGLALPALGAGQLAAGDALPALLVGRLHQSGPVEVFGAAGGEGGGEEREDCQGLA